MKKNLTEIVFILDRSGSMAGLEDDTIGEFNAMIQKYPKSDNKYIQEFRANLTKLNDLINGSRLWDIISLKEEHNNVIILLDEEKEQFKKEFFVSDNEIESINKAKERVNKLERKILLYEIKTLHRKIAKQFFASTNLYAFLKPKIK